MEKLSIIVPTRNRQKYAEKCVRTLLKFDANDYEVIVHDNSDNDTLLDMLKDVIDNKKLRYAYDPSVLSFCANFEKSIEMSTGDYLIMIGDDDCVLPEIIGLVDEIRKKSIDAVLFPTCISYVWPNAIKDNGGRLTIRKKPVSIKKLLSKNAIVNMIDSGNYDYQDFNFPKIYHGIVKREKLDLVKAQTGHYFGGLTPDIYSAVALSYYIDEMLYVNYPFTIPGMCAKSGSADSVTGRHTGELNDAPHFRGQDGYKWDNEVPYLYTVDTIWAETAFKAIKESGGDVKLNKDQYFNLMVRIGRRSLDFCDRLVKEYVRRFGGNEKTLYKRLNKKVKRIKMTILIKRGKSFMSQILHGRYIYNDVEDIEQAIEIVRKKQNKTKKVLERLKKL